MILENDFDEDVDSDDETNMFAIDQAVISSRVEIQKKENLRKIDDLKRTVLKQEKNIVKEGAKTELVPLQTFLSTSLSVELVYTMLFGITKFCLLNFMRNEFDAQQQKQF